MAREAIDEVRLERHIDQGSWVVVPTRLVTAGRKSGLIAEQRVVLAWSIRDGKALALRFFPSEEEANEALFGEAG